MSTRCNTRKRKPLLLLPISGGLSGLAVSVIAHRIKHNNTSGYNHGPAANIEKKWRHAYDQGGMYIDHSPNLRSARKTVRNTGTNITVHFFGAQSCPGIQEPL